MALDAPFQPPEVAMPFPPKASPFSGSLELSPADSSFWPDAPTAHVVDPAKLFQAFPGLAQTVAFDDLVLSPNPEPLTYDTPNDRLQEGLDSWEIRLLKRQTQRHIEREERRLGRLSDTPTMPLSAVSNVDPQAGPGPNFGHRIVDNVATLLSIGWFSVRGSLPSRHSQPDDDIDEAQSGLPTPRELDTEHLTAIRTGIARAAASLHDESETPNPLRMVPADTRGMPPLISAETAEQQVMGEILAVRRAEIAPSFRAVVTRGVRRGIMPGILEAFFNHAMPEAEALVHRMIESAAANEDPFLPTAQTVRDARSAVEDYTIAQRAELHGTDWDPMCVLDADQEFPDDPGQWEELLHRIRSTQNDVTLEALLTIAAHAVLVGWQQDEYRLPEASLHNELAVAIIDQLQALALYRSQLRAREWAEPSLEPSAPILFDDAGFSEVEAPRPRQPMQRSQVRLLPAAEHYAQRWPKWNQVGLSPSQWFVAQAVGFAYEYGLGMPRDTRLTHSPETLTAAARFAESAVVCLRTESPEVLAAAQQAFRQRELWLVAQATDAGTRHAQPNLSIEAVLADAYLAIGEVLPEAFDGLIATITTALELVVEQTDRALAEAA